MKRLLSLFLFVCAAIFGPLAAAADHLDGVLPLARDDLAAMAQAKGMPDRHVMLYFGDHLN